jgi:hypothetical protein
MASVRTDCNDYLILGAKTVPRLITRGQPLEVDAPGSRRSQTWDAGPNQPSDSVEPSVADHRQR